MYMNDMFDAATFAFLVFVTPNRTFNFIRQDQHLKMQLTWRVDIDQLGFQPLSHKNKTFYRKL